MQKIWGKEMRAMKDDRFLKFTLSLSRMNKKVQAVKTAGMGMVGLKAAHTAVLYALMVFTLVWLFRRCEVRWLAFLQPQAH